MPSKNTFSVIPIKKMLEQEIGKDDLWIDPFANKSRVAKITNDLNPEYDTDYHLDALEFLKMFQDNSVAGVLFDPPYSFEQAARKYNHITGTALNAHYKGLMADEISRIVKPGGKCITFGWDSNGLGKSRGFAKTKILLINHGACHYDTIVLIENKINSTIEVAHG
jgi:hypothetical protein